MENRLTKRLDMGSFFEVISEDIIDICFEMGFVFLLFLATASCLVLISVPIEAQSNNSQAKGLKQLTLGQSFNNYPAYWRQKNIILFTSDRRGDQDIFSYDLDSGEIKPAITSQNPDRMPSVSPDGNSIVFVREKAGRTDLYKYSPDSNRVSRLTSSSGNDTNPTWSPDGEWIYFQTNANGNWDIYRISSNGKHRMPVVDTDAAEKEPTLSEENLFYVSTKDRDDLGYSLWRSGYKGNEKARLTQTEYSYRTPKWVESEGGILLASDRGGGISMDVWLTDSRGEKFLQLTSTSASENHPGFASESGQIFFTSDKTFNNHLWKIDYIKTRTNNLLGELSEEISEVALKENIQNIGVFELNNYSMLKEGQLNWIQDHLSHRVINEGVLNVVDRSHLERILEELNYNQSDMVDPDKRLEVGKMAEVEAFVHGGALDFLYKGNQTTLLYLKLIKTGTSEVIWSYLGTAKGNPNPVLFEKVKTKLSQLPESFSVEGKRKRLNVLALWKNQSSSISEKYLDYITEYSLLKETSFKVSDRESLEYILKEKGLRYEGLIDPNRTSQLKVLPVEGIYFGRLLKDKSGNIHYFPKIIDVENGSILWSRELKLVKDRDRAQLLEKIAEQLVRGSSDSEKTLTDMIEGKKTVSVLPLKNSGPLSEEVLENQILNVILREDSFRVINREIIQEYLDEEREAGKELGLDKVAKVGEQVGIDVFLEVKFSSVGKTYATGLVRAVDVETAKYLGSFQFKVRAREDRSCDQIESYYDELEQQLSAGSYRSVVNLSQNILSMLTSGCEAKREEFYQKTLKNLGIAQYYLNNYRRSERRLRKHISKVGMEEADPRALYCLGDIRYRREQFNPAEKLFKKAVKKDKNFFEAHARLGDLYRQTGNYGEALTSYNKVPSDADVYGKILIKKALTSEESGNDTRAEELYLEASEYEEVEEPAYRNLGIMYYNRGLKLYEDNKFQAKEKFEKAEEYLKEVLKINPQDKTSYRALKNIYLKVDAPDSWKEAIKLVRRKEEYLGATSREFFLAGQMHLKFYKKYDEDRKREKRNESLRKAKETFEKALKRNEIDGRLTEEHKRIINDILE